MNLPELTEKQKKRLLNDLQQEEHDKKRKLNYNYKYPEFERTINSLNFIKSELQSNLNNNLKVINSNITDDVKNSITEHNNKINSSLSILDNIIFDKKHSFQDICIHEWITEYKYIQQHDIKQNDNKEYENCNDSDIENIKDYIKGNIFYSKNNIDENININEWKKTLVTKNFREYTCYDREIYNECKKCSFYHTISFYSK